VKKVGPFTWLTRDSVAAQPGSPPPTHLTPLPTLDHVGVDFMRTVFSLDLAKPETKTAVAWNDPKTIAYVVQVIDFSSVMAGKGEDAFRHDFLRWGATNPNPVTQASAQDARGNLGAKIKAIETEYNVKLLQPTEDAGGSKNAPAPIDNSDDNGPDL
jgi:hypothetical protein